MIDITSFVESRLGIFRMSGQELLDELTSKLRGYGYDPVYVKESFVYGAGSIPVMLIAHVDTVFEHTYLSSVYLSRYRSNTIDHDVIQRQRFKEIFWDRGCNVLWSPDGLGADDRAGVLGILALLDVGYRPHVLFTDGEESGGYGAEDAALMLYPEVNFLIELDRAGNMEAVFYSDKNKKFKKFVKRYGFHERIGSFSDISVLSPVWEISGVNLSAGYHHAHRETEYLNLNELQNTLDAVTEMLIDSNKRFKYTGKKSGVKFQTFGKCGWNWNDIKRLRINGERVWVRRMYQRMPMKFRFLGLKEAKEVVLNGSC